MMAGQTKLPIVTCVWCILVALSGCLPRGSRVLTEELAIERAVQATGVSRDRVRATVSQVTLSEQIVPFIEKSATRDAWRVDLSNVVITQIDGAQILINPHIKSLSVWVSSQTGQVIKVASPPPDKWAAINRYPPFPPIPDLERTMLERCEVYTALPNRAPKISLIEVLQVQPAASALNARQIIAYYVVYKLPEPKIGERAVWVAYLRGFPLSSSNPNRLPLDVLKSLRIDLCDWHCVNDAKTGRSYDSRGSCGPCRSY